MWQHRHTATVILVLAAGTARADFTSAWQDYFATHQMAAESHSGSVERCHAVGVTPDEPSFWDYMTGKNRAKLLSVKANIRATYSYFINPNLADGGRSYLPHLATGDVSALTWTNEAAFLTACGLPTNALADTPWFKLQYTNTVGGWHTARICLSNMIVTRAAMDWHPNVWTNMRTASDEVEYSSLPVVAYTAGGPAYAIPLSLLDIYPTWDFEPYYGVDWNGFVPGAQTILYHLDSAAWWPNARGVWTSHGDDTTWATNWGLAVNGWTTSLAYGSADWPTPPQSDYGMDWDHAFKPYMVKTPPKALLGGVCVIHSNEVVSVITNEVVSILTNYTGSNVVYDYTYDTDTITHWYTNTVTNIVSHVETNGYADITNYFTTTNIGAKVTNFSYRVSSYYPMVTSMVAFGTAYIGNEWLVSNISYVITGYTTNRDVIVTNAVVTNMPILTNVIDSITITNEAYSEEETIDTTNIISVTTNYVPDTNTAVIIVQTNQVEETVTNYVAGETYYAAGATQIDGVPYVGTAPYYLTLGIGNIFGGGYWIEPQYPGTNLYGMTPLWTGAQHRVDFYYQWTTPVTNFPPNLTTWHGYNEAYDNPNLSTDARYSSFASEAAGWVRDAQPGSSAAVVFGSKVYGSAFNGNLYSLSDVSFAQMKSTYETEFGEEPDANEVQILGREITNYFSAVWWNVDNGFKWFK